MGIRFRSFSPFGFACLRELPYEIAMDDHELLRAFARDRSQEAFRQLVVRHLRLVYAAAHRIVRDPHLAEEVAQNVFTLLAQKAGEIVPPQVVAGWLYNSTRHLAMHCVRSEQRRREREQTAVAMNALSESDGDARFVAEHLEEALAELEPADRDALVLRYLDDRSLRDVGRELGVSEDAARMRVNRAMERVRAVFQRRGATVTAVGFATAVTAASAAPPAGLAVSVTSAVLAATASTAVAQGVLMHWFTTKTALVATTAAVLAGGGTYLNQSRETARLEQSVAGLTQQQQAAQNDLEAAQAKINALNDVIRTMGQVQDDQIALHAENLQLKQEAEQAARSKIPLQNERSPVKSAQQTVSEPSEADRAIKTHIERYDGVRVVQTGANLYYMDYNRYPSNMDEMIVHTGSPVTGALREHFEMMPNSERIPERSTTVVLVREKEPRQLPDGRWQRYYAFSSGHATNVVQNSPDYSAFEAKHSPAQ
jgi:RNA polymerase sigma factor (sigma-70 family)